MSDVGGQVPNAIAKACGTLLLVAIAAQSATAQKNCKKGIPCGNTCISASKTCHVGEAPPTPKQSLSPTGSIEGDVYLVTRGGDTKKGAGNTIYLIPDGDSVRSDLRTACVARAVEKYRLEIAITAALNSEASIIRANNARLRAGQQEVMAAEAQAKGVVDSLERAFDADEAPAADQVFNLHAIRWAVDSAGTGVNAHYTFTSVKPGTYVLFGAWQIGDNRYRWLSTATLAPASAIKKDLDNSAIVMLSNYCRGPAR
jgi:hypothetical protein